MAQETVSLVASPKVAQEIWVNSRDFGNLDTGYRGWISRLKMYAQPLPLEEAAVERECFLPSPSTAIARNPTSLVTVADQPNAVVETSYRIPSTAGRNSGLSPLGSSASSFNRLFLMSVLIVVFYLVGRRRMFKPLSAILTSSRGARGGS